MTSRSYAHDRRGNARHGRRRRARRTCSSADGRKFGYKSVSRRATAAIGIVFTRARTDRGEFEARPTERNNRKRGRESEKKRLAEEQPVTRYNRQKKKRVSKAVRTLADDTRERSDRVTSKAGVALFGIGDGIYVSGRPDRKRAGEMRQFRKSRRTDADAANRELGEYGHGRSCARYRESRSVLLANFKRSSGLA